MKLSGRMRRWLPLWIFLCLPAGDASAKSGPVFVCTGSNWELRVGRGRIRPIPLQSDPGDVSAESFAALSIERGNRWFGYIRDTQGTTDWWAGEIVPDGSLRDTLDWEGRVLFVLADPPDTVEAQVVASTGCGDLWAGCRPVHLEKGYHGRFSDIAAPHPRHGPRVRVYLGVPAGRMPLERVMGVLWRGGR
jgi:hypothetical protein